VSKFFKALENAEKEREAESAPAAPEASPTGLLVAEPVAAAAPAAEADRPLATPAPIAAAPPETARRAPAPHEAPRPEPARTAPDARETAPHRTPPREAPPRHETAARETAPRDGGGSDLAAPARAPAEPAPVYGAPVARHGRGRGAHRRVFTAPLEPASADEPGDIDDHLVSLLEPTGYAAEQYRAIRLAVETARRERGLHVLGISSALRGEGKTITAINLAGALAQSPDAKVALVEADLRRPAVHDYLGLAPGRGLSTYLRDPALTVEATLERPASLSFSVVPAGPASSMPYELLKSPRLAALLAILRERFDYVVIDAPPVLSVPDVGILRDAVDAFVLVVRANRTPRESLNDAVDTIGRSRVLGLVFNDDERTAAAASDAGEAGWRRYLGRPLGGALVD
jgi:capsular exopolysaccharide synthesis family protein